MPVTSPIRKAMKNPRLMRAKENQMLSAGDIVELYIPDEFSKNEADTSEYDKIKASPTVIYEDDNIIICDKRAGMLSHTGDKGENGSSAIPERETLIFIIRAYLYKKGEFDPNDEASFSPALANRLDRNTGGLVIASKNAEALREMNRLIRDGHVDKRYLCAVHGKPSPSSATLGGYLFKNSKTKKVTVYSSPRQGAKEIITSYKQKNILVKMIFPFSKYTLKREGLIRYARILPQSDTLSLVRVSTVKTKTTALSATSIKRCIPTAYHSQFPTVPFHILTKRPLRLTETTSPL